METEESSEERMEWYIGHASAYRREKEGESERECVPEN